MKRSIILLALSISIASAQPAGYTHGATFVIDHTKVPNTNQTNFPVVITGTVAALKSVANGGQMNSASGYDITFSSDSGGSSILPYERLQHNTSIGRIVYWVKIPTVATASDTTIYAWWGNPAITTDGSTPTSVWDTNYKGVWHMNDNASSTTVVDSTGVHNGTNQAVTSLKTIAGEIPNQRGLTYAGSTDFTNATGATSDFNFTSGAFTFEFWLKINSPWVAYETWFGNGIFGGAGYYFQEGGGNNHFMFTTNHGSSSFYDDGTAHALNTWYHVVIVRNGTTLTMYLNGAVDQTFAGTYVDASTTTDVFTMSGSAAGHAAGNDVLQEFRVSNTNRSADWITTSYNNQVNPGTFFKTAPAGWSWTSTYPPACAVSASQSIGLTDTLSLSSTGSSANDGSGSLAYLWQQVPSAATDVPMQKNFSLSSTTVASPTATGPWTSGPINVQLTVTQAGNGESLSCTSHNGAVEYDANGIVTWNGSLGSVLGGSIQTLLGDMHALGHNPWPYYDTANANDEAVQNSYMDSVYGDYWNTAAPGTITVTDGSFSIIGDSSAKLQTLFCGAGGTTPITGIAVVVWWRTADGTGRTGRRVAGYNVGGPGGAWVASCSDEQHLTLAQNSWKKPWIGQACPSSGGGCSGLQYSVMSGPALNEYGFGDAPGNYYESHVGSRYALYYRSGIDTYLINARTYADRFWYSPWIDMGGTWDGDGQYGFPVLYRCWSVLGMVLRAMDTGDGHPDMWPGLHLMADSTLSWFESNGNAGSNQDAREVSYGLAQLTYIARYDTDLNYRQKSRNMIERLIGRTTDSPNAVPDARNFTGSPTAYKDFWISRRGTGLDFGSWPSLWGAPNYLTGHRAVLTYGSKTVTCEAPGLCGWTTADFAPYTSNLTNSWLFYNTQTYYSDNVANAPDSEAYCYAAGVITPCVYQSATQFQLDRPYNDPTCVPNCTKSYIKGSEGAAGEGQTSFYMGIQSWAFHEAGDAMSCVTPGSGLPIGCNDAIAAKYYGIEADAVTWMMNNSFDFNAGVYGFWYFRGFPGQCYVPLQSHAWCNGHYGTMAQREYSGDGFRGLITYYQRSGNPTLKGQIDTFYSCLWGKVSTSPLVACPDNSYDDNFEPGGTWMTGGHAPDKLFGQMFGFQGMYTWPAFRIGGPAEKKSKPIVSGGVIGGVVGFGGR